MNFTKGRSRGTCPVFSSRRTSSALGSPSTWTRTAWRYPSVRRGIAASETAKLTVRKPAAAAQLNAWAPELYPEEAAMWQLAVSFILAGAGSNAFAGAPDAPTAYPDLSEPKAAAFSLGIALAKGDAKTARSIYIGKQKEFFSLLDALAKAAGSAKKFSRAATAKYGENAATLTVPTAALEPKLGKSKAPLTSLIAAADVKERGEEATLVLEGTLEIQ